jgi:hypothetical protein
MITKENIKGQSITEINRKLVSDFLQQFLTSNVKTDTLFLNFNAYNVFEFATDSVTEIKDKNEVAGIAERKFDLIIGNALFCLQAQNTVDILNCLKTLKEDGQVLLLVEPSILCLKQGQKFLDCLKSENLYCNSAFEVPEKLFPQSALRPIIIHLEKQKLAKFFIGSITSDFIALFNNFTANKSSNRLETGVLIEKESFVSFDRFRVEVEINNLQTQYKEYTRYELKNIAREINTTNANFQSKPNCIYIPKLGNSAVVAYIGDVTIKHQNLFQIVLDPKFVQAEFLALFFKSDLGKQSLKALLNGGFIPRITQTAIANCLVPLPELAQQKLLVKTNKKLSELQNTINELKSELSLNPKNANSIIRKAESIQKPLVQFSDEEKLLNLLRKNVNVTIINNFGEMTNVTINQLQSEASKAIEEIKRVILDTKNIEESRQTEILECLVEIKESVQNNDKIKSSTKFQKLFELASDISSISSWLTTLGQFAGIIK